MGEGPTLITTTRLGVRPLGVRGEPLHNTHAQLRQVIRRRLGDGPADLLAEPQMRESGDGIDWYAAWPGPVSRLSEVLPEVREMTLARIATDLAAVDALGDQLGASDSSEEARLVGRSLKLATQRPSDDFVYLVGDRPAIVAWGYEADSASSLLGAGLPTAPVPTPPPPSAVFVSVPALPYASTRVGWAPWLRALIFGLLLLLLLLMASWLLRACMPVPPELSIAMHETPAPPAPEPPPDPTPILKAALDDFQGDEKKLRAELASLEDDLKKKIEECKPPEPPKVEPPKVVQAPRPPPPPPPPKPQAAVQPPPPPPPPAPPISRPPPGQLPCDWSGDSGGEGVTRNKHYLGDRPGFVTINYNLYVRPDEIRVMYRGRQIAGTQGPRSGRGGFGFDWNPVGGDNSVDVIVIGEMLGTRWQYAMACPRR